MPEKESLTLYMRGMNKPGEDTDCAWDDTALNQAFTKAMKTVNEDVAKRIAMGTNSNYSGNRPKAEAQVEVESQGSDSPIVWKEGMPCRAVYEEDGLEYEAFLICIGEGDDCVVQFLGYDNNETVPLSSLRRSLGDQARLEQLNSITGMVRERGDDDGFESQPGSESQLGSESVDAYSDSSMQEPNRHVDAPDMSRDKKKMYNKKRTHESPRFNNSDLPPLPMPNMNMFRNMGGPEMSIPPPPLPHAMMSQSHACRGRNDAEGQAISDMLLSWYMTGYYTGLYQGQKKQKQCRRCQ